MATADFNPDDFQDRNQSRMDEGLLVKFYITPKEDAAATEKEGRPMFKDVEYIDIKIPGDRLGGIARPARQADINRFPRHYAAFKNRTEDTLIEGTLLSEWPLVTRSQVEQLSFSNVKTVEQLVAMSDQNAQQFMGINGLKAKAKQWLEFAKEGKAASDLATELSKRDEEIEALKKQMDKLIAATAPETVVAAPKRRKKASRKKVAAKKE